MIRTSRTVRLAAQAAAVGLVLTTAAVPAFADEDLILVSAEGEGDGDGEGDEGEGEGEGSSIIPATAITEETGTLDIHKHIKKADGYNEGGVEITPAPERPLEGVKFKISKIAGDITTPEGMKQLTDAAKAYDPTDESTTPALAEGSDAYSAEVTTNAQGIAAFADVPVGAYLVEETDISGAVLEDGETLVKAKKFIAFVPVTNAAGDGWNYNVHAYPKNSVVTNEKIADNSELPNAGDELPYWMTLGLPQPDPEGKIAKYEVTDPLPAQVAYKSVEVGYSDQTAADLVAGGTVPNAFTVENDYTVNVTQDAEGNDVVKVVFTDAGLQKLTDAKNANENNQVVVKLVTTVKSDFQDGDGVNKAEVVFNNGSGNGDVENETNEDGPIFGKLKVLKKGEDEEANGLDGADFQIYRCTGADNLVDGPLTIEGTDTFTSATVEGQAGVFVFEALNVPEADADWSGYCLVETKAPAGYELLPAPIYVAFTEADLPAAPEARIKDIEIDNVKKTTGEGGFLPSTGGVGVGILIALGLAIVGLGGFAARRQSKKA